MSGLLFNRENLGKLFIRLVLGIILAARGVMFLVGGQSSLTMLGDILSIVGVTLWPLYLGGVIAICHVVCGITVALGTFFKTSTFLFGTFFLLEAASKYHAGNNLIGEVSYLIMLSAIMYGFMFIGSGSYAVQKQ
ncbi:MAG: hypothetical protein LBJ75_03630 [Puniceicoccales bacterium]|jgi:uncharacterized membrane protein YphA (DoxX/SURF4 family)|nr:hypothetical protein [Puniceicoccales bacterium]MDR1233321.1 hypothetical protein [Puniceicoccales bacterium]